MKIPNKIRIGGHIYTIKKVKPNLDQEELADGFKCGETDVGKNIIRLDMTMKESQIEETFIHEILHAINNELRHDLLHNLAHSLHQVLRDNKLLK